MLDSQLLTPRSLLHSMLLAGSETLVLSNFLGGLNRLGDLVKRNVIVMKERWWGISSEEYSNNK